MDRAVVASAQERKVRQRGGPALRPVPDVMALRVAPAAAREAAAVIPLLEGAPEGRRDRPRPGPDLGDAPVGVVPHDHAGGVAGEALRRSRGNVLAAFLEDGLPGLGGIGQHRRIDVDDDLVALGRRAGIEALVEGDLGEEAERIGLLLLHGRGLHGLVHETHGGCRSPPPLVKGLPRGVQRLDEKGPDLGLEPALEDEHAVVPGEEIEGPAAVPVPGFLGLDVLVDAPPAAHDALDVLGGPGAADPVEALFGLGVATRVRARTLE